MTLNEPSSKAGESVHSSQLMQRIDRHYPRTSFYGRPGMTVTGDRFRAGKLAVVLASTEPPQAPFSIKEPTKHRQPGS